MATWQHEGKAALKRAIIKHGDPVKPLEDEPASWVWQYGRLHPDWPAIRRHLAPTDKEYMEAPGEGCTITATGEVIEASWSQFMGTFESDRVRYAVDLTGCSCACGRYTDLRFGWDTSLGEALTKLFAEEEK